MHSSKTQLQTSAHNLFIRYDAINSIAFLRPIALKNKLSFLFFFLENIKSVGFFLITQLKLLKFKPLSTYYDNENWYYEFVLKDDSKTTILHIWFYPLTVCKYSFKKTRDKQKNWELDRVSWRIQIPEWFASIEKRLNFIVSRVTDGERLQTFNE